MPHIVIYRAADGNPGYREVDGLDDAVSFVEHLRNTEQVNDSRIFAMQEVPIEFKTYYRVEVAGAEPVATPPQVAAPAAPPAPSPQPPTVDAPSAVDPKAEPVGAGAGGRFGLFGKA